MHLRIRFRVVRVRVPMSGVATRVKKCDCCLEKFRALDNSAKTPMLCRTTGVRCAPVDLLQGEVAAAGDVIHDAGSALNGALDKRRTGGCLCMSTEMRLSKVSVERKVRIRGMSSAEHRPWLAATGGRV